MPRMMLHTNTIHANVNCTKVFLAILKCMPLLRLKQKHPNKSFPSKFKKKSKQDIEALVLYSAKILTMQALP